MTLRYDMYNRIYDDAEPVFIYVYNASMIYDRLSHKEVTTASLMAQAASLGYTLAAPEIGTGTTVWQARNKFPGEDGNTPPVFAPITALVTYARTNRSEITISGGPSDKAYSIEVKVNTSSSDPEDLQVVPVAKGDTAAQVAAAIVAAISYPGVTATVVSGTVARVVPKSGETLTIFSATVK